MPSNSHSETQPKLPRFLEITASNQTPTGLTFKRFFTDTEAFNPSLILGLSGSDNLPLLVSRFPDANPSLEPHQMEARRAEWFYAAVRYRLFEHFSTGLHLASPTIRFLPLHDPVFTPSGQREVDCFGTTLIEIPNDRNA